MYNYNIPVESGRQYKISGIPPGASALAVFRMRWKFHSVTRTVSSFAINGPKQYLIASLRVYNRPAIIFLELLLQHTHMQYLAVLSKYPLSCKS